MAFNLSKLFADSDLKLSNDQHQQLAYEKLFHMQKSAKQSILPAFMGPLLCVPLFLPTAGRTNILWWIITCITCLIIRTFLIYSIDLTQNADRGLSKISWAIGLSSSCWGLGWLLLLPTQSLENYLLYYTVTLIFIFINMFGNCIHRTTLICFIFPLQIGLFAYYLFIPNAIVNWPIVIGSALFFYFSIKLGLLFAESWQKNILLRFNNETLLTQLTIEKDASVAANIAKSAFIATASHDLRQPMQAINIFLALIDDKKNSAEEKNKLIEKLKISANQLNKMFKTLLDISKLDAQSIHVKTNRFHANDLILDLKNLHQPVASQKKLDLVFKSEPWDVIGDRLLLQQILTNLISNALQYTNHGGVEIIFRSEAGNLSIDVIDTGLGISENDMVNLYTEFYRVQNTRSMHDGLGLGLSIVKRVAQLIGAQVIAKSTLNQGTQFTIKTQFPLAELSVVGDNTGSNHLASTSEVDARNNATICQKSLAIIEDDLALLDAYQKFFTLNGFLVYNISLSEDALRAQLFEIPHIDFILSDYRLENQSGVDYIQIIREEYNSEIPAIIITADTSPDHIKLFKELNIQTLHKPVDPQTILLHINNSFEYTSSKR